MLSGPMGANPGLATPETIDFAARSEILPRYVGAGPRYTSYPTVPAWTTEFGREEHETALRGFGGDGVLARCLGGRRK